MKYLKRILGERLPFLPIAGLALGNLGLTAGILYMGLRGRDVLVIPGVAAEQVRIPSHVPDESIRNFASLYLLYFDDYTPATVVERANYLLRFVGPDRIEAARHALEDRATYAVRARESSQLSLPLPAEIKITRLENGRARVELTGVRRTFIADAPKDSLKVTYALEVASVIPSVTNRFGIVVVAQRIDAQPIAGSERKEDEGD